MLVLLVLADLCGKRLLYPVVVRNSMCMRVIGRILPDITEKTDPWLLALVEKRALE